MKLSQSVAIVTGGSRGLGLAVAEALRSAGMIVEAPSQTQVDVRDAKQVSEFVQHVQKMHGRIDVLINNAGWSEVPAPLEEITTEDFDRCIDTNLKGVFYFLHAVLPVMKKQNSGIVVNVCSKAGTRAHSLLPAYSASKFAVRGLTQAVARNCNELKLSVRCISVSPGGIDTDMRALLFGREDSEKQQKPETVAGIMLEYLQGAFDVSNGADIQIVKGKVDRIIDMDA